MTVRTGSKFRQLSHPFNRLSENQLTHPYASVPVPANPQDCRFAPGLQVPPGQGGLPGRVIHRLLTGFFPDEAQSRK